MARLFIGIALPPVIAQHVALIGGGIPGARFELPEKLHLTLRFLGDTEGEHRRAVEEALEQLDVEAFDLTLAGVGHFPPRGQPRSLWVGVDQPQPVATLHRKVERRLEAVGIPPDSRKFSPHVTIARLKGSPERKVADFIIAHALFRASPFRVDHITLFSSILHPGGSRYFVERQFPLRTPSEMST